MATEIKKEVELELAHVLFIDIVAYSKRLINDQRTLLETLNHIVRNTDQFGKAEAVGRLIKIPTGDGMALVFYNTPEAPAECALEINRALKRHPELQLRMGVHSGPVSGVVDVNERANVAGAGINMAQRVMDCGDAGHILISKRVAGDLEQYGHWQPHLHDLGECEVKHGHKIEVVNLFTAELGNPQVPEKFRQTGKLSPGTKPSWVRTTLIFSLIALGIVALILISVVSRLRERDTKNTAAPANESLAKPMSEKSIAVLPFENFSESKENQFFADGVQDDILTALSKVADLKVISRMSVMTYAAGAKRNLREVAQTLGVSHILEGSVRRAGDKIRVSAQLIDARRDAHVWAETYDRDLADVFAIQSDIAKIIADQLRAKLSPSEQAAIAEPPTKDIGAHDLYVRAKLLYESSSYNSRRMEKLVEAAGLLDQAVARDPGFFSAHCLLSNTHGLVYFYGLDHTAFRRSLAEAALDAASRLRPDAGETHLARADFFYRFYLDYDRTLSELAAAQSRLANNPQVFILRGYIDRRQNRWAESVQNMERGLEVDPRNWFYLQQIALTYESLRRYAHMAAALDRVIAILPDDVPTRMSRALVDVHWRADLGPLREIVAAVTKEDSDAAKASVPYLLFVAMVDRDRKAAERAIALLPPQGIGNDSVVFPTSFWKGFIARQHRDSAAAADAFQAAREQVNRVVHEQSDYGPALCVLGVIDAGLGKKEQAISEGRRACELLPVAKDCINGVHMLSFLSVIYAWTGEKDLAVEQLKTALQYPGTLSYGQLQLHPWWDPLRDDPRFQQIVASLAPKE
jgi:TolB-like protein/class 3 adenylate cyclase